MGSCFKDREHTKLGLENENCPTKKCMKIGHACVRVTANVVERR